MKYRTANVDSNKVQWKTGSQNLKGNPDIIQKLTIHNLENISGIITRAVYLMPCIIPSAHSNCSISFSATLPF